MVIGETGSGKSTWLNFVTNYFRGGCYPHSVKVLIPTKIRGVTEADAAGQASEANVRDQSKSQTTKCTWYYFNNLDHSFCFGDTPGLGDTEGVKKDDTNVQEILEAAENAGELHGMILVINGSAPRLTDHAIYVLDKLRGNLPDVVMKNLVVVMTNCSELTVTFPFDSLKKFQPRGVFFMDNAFFHRLPKTEAALEEAHRQWARSWETMEKIEQLLIKLHGNSTEHFKVLREKRSEIKQNLHSCTATFEGLQTLYNELQAFSAEAKSHGDAAQTFSQYKSTKTIRVPVQSEGPLTTTCAQCSHSCHIGCKLDEVTATGTDHFRRCWAIEGENCKECPGKCHHTQHYHSHKIIRIEVKTIEQVLEDVKAKHDASINDQNIAKANVADKEGAIKVTKQALEAAVDKIVGSMREIKKVASHFNLTNELYNELAILKKKGEALTTPEARDEHEKMIRIVELQLQALLVAEGAGPSQGSAEGARSSRARPRPPRPPSSARRT